MENKWLCGVLNMVHRHCCRGGREN